MYKCRCVSNSGREVKIAVPPGTTMSDLRADANMLPKYGFSSVWQIKWKNTILAETDTVDNYPSTEGCLQAS